MHFVIDYRNGSMGHTILSHALFSCNQIDLDPNILFSKQATAHQITKFNLTNLICNHNLEHPIKTPHTTILGITCNDWDEVLRNIMSYYKYYQAFPTANNLHDFCFEYPDNVLPLEFLTITYFDSYSNLYACDSDTMTLGQYLDYKIDPLKLALKKYFNWQWDDERGQIFYQHVIEKNQKYFLQLQDLKNLVYSIIDKRVQNCELEFWQKAIVISMVCKHKNINPSLLHWNECDFLLENTKSLIDSLTELCQ